MEKTLIEKFEEIINELATKRTGSTFPISPIYKEAMQAAYNLAKQEDGWVSVHTNMPPESRYVLVYIKERKMSFMAYRKDGWWQGEYSETINNNTATHWMPLPITPTI